MQEAAIKKIKIFLIIIVVITFLLGIIGFGKKISSFFTKTPIDNGIDALPIKDIFVYEEVKDISSIFKYDEENKNLYLEDKLVLENITIENIYKYSDNYVIKYIDSLSKENIKVIDKDVNDLIDINEILKSNKDYEIKEISLNESGIVIRIVNNNLECSTTEEIEEALLFYKYEERKLNPVTYIEKKNKKMCEEETIEEDETEQVES